MINKILIANRGEIALRVIKTCKRLGIETVTLYATDDANLPHASAGDENIHLGRGPLSNTYLDQEKIIKIALDTGANAIHPGYGFFSENTEFCKKVAANGLIFIGPSVDSIELMGDKKESKVKMETLKIPLVPGYHGENQEPALLFEEAKKIGFPVLIKATAGGGGKGMRIVNNEGEFSDALSASKREAMNAFSNDKVLLEKYIINPRHIEVQLVSDGKGNHFHFFERECSIQRRYQKVIEETPSVAISEQQRMDMCQTAVDIAKGIDYVGAGTIEYILAPDDNFYFLEMNTRLQVEHPVTELVTGFDLVELQIIAASGKAFDFSQDDISQEGHAIECRVYAEDPDNDFLPTSGRIQFVQANSKKDYRLDCGYKNGNRISTSYDPMLAKVIVWESERMTAIDSMQEALNDVVFAGAKTNRDYLKRILDHENFETGDIHTHFIEQEKQSLKKMELSAWDSSKIIAAALGFSGMSTQNIWGYNFKATEKNIFIDDVEHNILMTEFNQDRISFVFENVDYEYRVLAAENNSITLQSEDGEFLEAFGVVFDATKKMQLFVNNKEVFVQVKEKVETKSSSLSISEGGLLSPMPGKIFKIHLQAGSSVKEGEPVLIVEAMKMEHTIRSPRDGIIKEIFYKEGDQVQGGVILCEIE